VCWWEGIDLSDYKRYSTEPDFNQTIKRMIRVNQAGEYGAKRIYEGQLAALKNHACAETIQHMKDQEQVHLDTFNEMMVDRRVRPTALQPLWHAAGYALGYVTGKMGEKAAMACTVAVEEVIDQHYQAQVDVLEAHPDEADLKNKIVQFQAEEQEHRDIGLDHGAEQTPAYPVLSVAIKAASKLAIFLSKRV
jgi:ubiquinone biosynthesis monooxygenase Coq7